MRLDLIKGAQREQHIPPAVAALLGAGDAALGQAGALGQFAKPQPPMLAQQAQVFAHLQALPAVDFPDVHKEPLDFAVFALVSF